MIVNASGWRRHCRADPPVAARRRQDLFFAGQLARVVTVHADVDGGTHVGVVLEDDPASELHEWYGRYLYFAPPDEVEPVSADTGKDGQP